MPKSDHHSDDDERSRRGKRRRRRREGKDDHNNDSDDGSNDDDVVGDRKKRHRSSRKKDYRRDEESDSSSSSSSTDGESDDEGDEDRRRRKRRDKKSKKRRKDDKKKKSSRKKKSKSSKHDKKKRSKKRRRRDDDDDDDDYKKKRHSNNNSSDTDTGGEDNEEGALKIKELARNYELAEALYQLLVEHPTPAMAKDTLPLVLFKLGGGTSLDLSQMPDRSASLGIQRVLGTLQPFGVGEEGPQVWKWTVPGGGSDERFLLRIVRTLLNDIGFTMEAITQKDQKERDETVKRNSEKKENVVTENNNTNNNNFIKDYTVKLLQDFQTDQAASTLPGELGGLCKMLLEGENVALGGLPDPKLRQSLEKLFDQCGLEMQEMDPDSDEEEEEEDADNEDDDEKQNDNSRDMGYGLPESPQLEKEAQAKLLLVMRACETVASSSITTTTKAAVARKGPMPMPANYKAPEESSDEEGPAPVGAAAKRKEPPPMSKELIKHQAEMRARQLRGAVTGQEELMSTDPNTREEWMLDPGKFDFLSSIKAGNPMKSRNFRGKSKASGAADAGPSRVMDANIKAEMDAIMQAHTNARGPTLVEQHRLKKQQEREAKAAAGGGKKGQWNWSRNKDLDSGRRVDKDALHQVLGGATEDLKKKFQGGF